MVALNSKAATVATTRVILFREDLKVSIWGRKYCKDKTFGSGNAADNFISVLNQPSFWSTELQKQFNDQI